MILQALHSLYDRLAQDESANVPPFGYSTQKIAFAVVLTPEGELVQFEDRRTIKGKRKIPLQLSVPGQTKPSGSGVNPCFLWDNTQYLLGYKKEDDKPDRTAKACAAFREKHQALKPAITSPAFAVVCQFLRNWNPADAVSHPLLAEVSGGFGVFQILGQRRYVHEDPVVSEWWAKNLPADGEEELGFCLITGEKQPIARLHEPAIKGFPDAPSSSGRLVSFNESAFTSHGKEQGANAPVSRLAAFKYASALNVLTNGARSSQQRIKIGEATTVFWTERDSPVEGFFGLLFDAREDTGQNESLRLFLEAVREGRMPGDVDPNMKFYILGLSPNAARLAVRFWHVSTVADISEKLGQYFRDIAIRKSFDNEPDFPSLQQLLRETAVLRKYDNIPPLLAGAMMRAIFTGQPFPNNLLPVLLDRIRAEQAGEYPNVNYLRACLLAGVLRRNHKQEVNPMAYDWNNTQPGYRLGGVFATLERIQERSAGRDINATVRDRYYGAASATPVTAFPILVRLVNHWLGKLENRGEAVNFEKLLARLMDGVCGAFPAHLNLEQQGLFALGYYQMRQEFFTKTANNKNKPEEK
jgi:CRISPR-associated protein Csd1